VRTRDRRDLLISVRAAVLRADFFADEVLAIPVLLSGARDRHAKTPEMK
jgi:hypothetical protein